MRDVVVVPEQEQLVHVALPVRSKPVVGTVAGRPRSGAARRLAHRLAVVLLRERVPGPRGAARQVPEDRGERVRVGRDRVVRHRHEYIYDRHAYIYIY